MGVGLITEADVNLAMAAGAIIVGFHTRPDNRAQQLAISEGVNIRLYQVIYEVESEIKAASRSPNAGSPVVRAAFARSIA